MLHDSYCKNDFSKAVRTYVKSLKSILHDVVRV